jgi:biotin--protein ligase
MWVNLCRCLEALSGLLASSGGFAPLEEAYLRQWLHTDQEVALEENGVGTYL